MPTPQEAVKAREDAAKKAAIDKLAANLKKVNDRNALILANRATFQAAQKAALKARNDKILAKRADDLAKFKVAQDKAKAAAEERVAKLHARMGIGVPATPASPAPATPAPAPAKPAVTPASP